MSARSKEDGKHQLGLAQTRKKARAERARAPAAEKTRIQPPASDGSDVVLVLGMHRSGTSAVAGTLMKLGGTAPEHFMSANEYNARGYFESVSFMQLHDQILASAGTDWQDWRPFNPEWYRSPVASTFKRRAKELLETEFDAVLPVLKDPRVCRFVPFWLDALRDMQKTPRIVMPIRSPLDVAQSLKARDGFPLPKGLLLWLRHVLDAEAHSRTEARSIFAWSDFPAHWRAICDKIAAETGLAWPRLSDRTTYEIDHFLSGDLVHHETDRAALRAHADVHEWALEAHDALMELTRSPSSAPAFATLDRIRALLDQSSRMFGRVLVDYEIGIETLREQTGTLTGERDSLHARHDELSAETAAAVAERDTLREEGIRVAADVQARQQELAAAATALAELEQRHTAAETERDDLRQERASLAADVQARQQELGAAATALAELEQRHTAAASGYDAAVAETAELRNELSGLRQRVVDLVDDRARLQADAGTAEAALRDELARNSAALSAVRQKNAQHADQLAEALAEREELQRALGETTSLSADLKARLDETRRAVAEARRDNEWLAQARDTRVAEIGALQRDLAAVARARDEAQAALSKAHGEKNRLSTDLCAANTALALARAESADIDAFQRDLAAVGQERDEARAALSEAHGEKDRLSTDLCAANAALALARAESAELATRNEQAAREKQGLASERDHLSSQLRSAEQLAAERASAQAAAHAQALAAARRGYEAELGALHGQLVDAQLVDAEATAAHVTAPRIGLWARLLPRSLRRRALAKQLVRSGLFDSAWYRATYPDIAKSGIEPVKHYLEAGFAEGRKPNPFFDTRFYLERYEDVRRSGVNPLLHYLQHGWREGRDPGPAFQTDYYLDANPDVRALDTNPLAHYLRHGRHEGRLTVRPP